MGHNHIYKNLATSVVVVVNSMGLYFTASFQALPHSIVANDAMEDLEWGYSWLVHR